MLRITLSVFVPFSYVLCVVVCHFDFFLFQIKNTKALNNAQVLKLSWQLSNISPEAYLTHGFIKEALTPEIDLILEDSLCSFSFPQLSLHYAISNRRHTERESAGDISPQD